MFLVPEKIGQGLGKKMMIDFMERAHLAGCSKVALDAEPYAKEFYLKMGFEEIGQIESSMAGRFLPIMEKSLLGEDQK